jgi:hypothetical protein
VIPYLTNGYGVATEQAFNLLATDTSMAHQIIRQPNGLYALWSTCVDNFTLLDATESEIVNELVSEYGLVGFRQACTDDVRRKVAMLEDGKPAYHQFTRSFEECVATIRELHGDDDQTLQMIAELVS